MGPVFQRPAANRLSLKTPGGRMRGSEFCGWAVWILLGLGTVGRAAPAAPTPATVYQQAQARFRVDDLAGALSLLDRVPAKNSTDRERADIANLRGAIALRQRHYDQARAEFAAAAAQDPHLWAARYNEAEVSFRRGRYDEASRQFGDLLGRTTGLLQGRERRFAEYKRLLADLLAGREQPAQAFVAGHQEEKNPPLAYYYLHAALAERHGQARQGEQWLAQVDEKYPAEARTVFAESFQNVGWLADAQPGRLVAMVNDNRGVAAVQKSAPGGTGTAAPAATVRPEKTPGKPAAAVVPPKPAFRTEADAPAQPAFRTSGAARDIDEQMPPVVDAGEPQTLVEDAAVTRTGTTGPAVLGKPSSGHRATPTPSPQPSASPATDDGPSPAPTASPAATATPAAASATPAPAFVQKYEAAYVKYLEKDYQGAKTLLDEADAIQPGQKSSADLRDLIFKAYYEAGYVSFRKSDFPTALEQLGNADAVKPNNPDSLNLRGLVLSRERKYDEAEAAFRKASQLDPSFYAAKFNYAELPFNYRNYTVARGRFEELFSQTDPAKQPVEAEITQFKVFLTLLLEGKIDAARGFMDHFTFTGATPARYFCQAALDFYAGNMEKAQGWIDSAGKEFKPQLVSIFKESFYRIGWMTDVNGQSSFAGAPGTPAPSASPAASATPAVALVNPSASVAPTSSSAAVLALNSATPRASVPVASSPVAVTPAASAAPKPAASVAAASVAPTPIKPPVAVTAATPAPSAAPVVATRTPAVAAASATPIPTVAGATPALAKVTPTPEEKSTPAAETTSDSPSQGERVLQIILIGLIVIPTIATAILTRRAQARRHARLLARRRSAVYSDGRKELEPEEAQTPR